MYQAADPAQERGERQNRTSSVSGNNRGGGVDE